MNRSNIVRRGARGVRDAMATAVAATVATVPALEPLTISAGRAAARRSRLLAGLYWVVQQRLLGRLRRGDERFRMVQVLDHVLQLDITDATGRYPYFYGTPYEEGVTHAVASALRPGDVFVDVGANVGYFTVFAAARVGPLGRVVAFEPHEGARESLETLVQRNEVADRVEIVPLALADGEADALLFTEEGVSAHSTIEPSLSPMRHTADLRPTSVTGTTTLDGWLTRRPDLRARVRCIKIDVEGAEARVLTGMRGLLPTPGLRLVCETTIGSAGDAMLAEAGFERRRTAPGSDPYGNFLYMRPSITQPPSSTEPTASG